MLGKANRSPAGRGLDNVQELVARIEAYEQWKSPTKIDFELVLGKEAYAKYWSMWDKINAELRECQVFADSLRAQVLKAIAAK